MCALGTARLVGNENRGKMTIQQGKGRAVASSPKGCVPGVEACVAYPDHSCLVIGVIEVSLLAGSLAHVTHHSSLSDGAPSEQGPLVIGTRSRWHGMPGFLL